MNKQILSFRPSGRLFLCDVLADAGVRHDEGVELPEELDVVFAEEVLPVGLCDAEKEVLAIFRCFP